MRSFFLRCSVLIFFGLWMEGCQAIGSCLFTTDAGYNYCEDFLGTEYNHTAAENACSTGNGAYSSSPCSMAGALGVCAIGTGTADNYQYTYTVPAGESDAGSVTTATVESACGIAGGTFTAG
jgi:hypothetical protein